MRTFRPQDHPVPLIHQLLLSGVAPRPIALVSTLDADGRRNLSPFSFFNAFGANPPVVVVSPAYRGHDGTPKHTFLNILETKEFTVSAVTHAMVEQISLASSDYPAGVDEFVKAGFTPLDSSMVAAPGVAESPFVMECRLLQHVDTGGHPASGNLLIAEVVCFHVRESAFDGERIDPRRLDLVARMGHTWYCRANGDALFELPKPRHAGVGFDALPAHVRTSAVLTGNELARLAGVESVPDMQSVLARWHSTLERIGPAQQLPDMFEVELRAGEPLRALTCVLADMRSGTTDRGTIVRRLHLCARAFLLRNDIEHAWECAIAGDPDIIAQLGSALRADA